MNLVEFLDKKEKWSRKTFGEGQRTQGVIAHIKEELKEIEENPNDLFEWIDVVLLALDGAWRAGYTSEQIQQALIDKQEINYKRIFPKNNNQDISNNPINQDISNNPINEIPVNVDISNNPNNDNKLFTVLLNLMFFNKKTAHAAPT